MGDERQIEQVAELMRAAAAQAILPRFRKLAKGEVEEKSPGDMVTIADREAEAIIERGLAAIAPGALVLGEEAAAARPALLDEAAKAAGTVWVVDPVDGTANFVDGHAAFAVMIARIDAGTTTAAWILDPVTDSLAVAVRGGGARIDGREVDVPDRPADVGRFHTAVYPRFLPDELRATIAERAHELGRAVRDRHCAGSLYPAMAAGEIDTGMFWRLMPWDHAPGCLFLEEAGGRAARFDGSPYRPLERRRGLLVARSPQVWDATAGILLRDVAAALVSSLGG